MKLRFKSAASKGVACIRSFHRTKKASKMEYKAVESVLQTINPHSGGVQFLLLSFPRRKSILLWVRRRMFVYQTNISKNKVDFKQPIYKDNEKRYFDQLIQIKGTHALPHHEIEETNKIIRDLWQKNYRGQSIDNISIHLDSEGAGTLSYSYKLLV